MKFYEGKIETLKFIAGHAMILGHMPSKLSLQKVSEKILKETEQGFAHNMESFGLFDSSSPNYATYYPEVTVEDLQPKDSEFIEPVFRMLSNTVVQHKYNPIEFPEDVLKASMHKLVGLTINADHETALGNGIGAIKSVEWQDSYKIGNFTVPAGINAVLKIDGKSNPRIARGIMMDPPSIHSNSVTVGFSWVPSHPTMTENDFYNKLGTMDEKGKLIRKVANQIKFYTETSLVGLGADPFAQLIRNGKMVNPSLAKSREPIDKRNLSESNEAWDSLVMMDWKNPGELTDIVSNSIEQEDLNTNKNSFNMEKYLRFLEVTFGLETNSLTEENYEAKLAEINTEVTNLRADTAKDPDPIVIEGLTGIDAITTAVKELGTLKSQLPEGLSLSETVNLSKIGSSTISELRVNTLRLYRLSLKDKTEDVNLISLINTSEYPALKALHTQYDSLTDDELSFTCSECGSHKVTRASAAAGEGDDLEDKTTKTTQELIDKFTGGGDGSFTIFKTDKKN